MCLLLYSEFGVGLIDFMVLKKYCTNVFQTSFIVGDMITPAKGALGWVAFIFGTDVKGVILPALAAVGEGYNELPACSFFGFYD